MYSRILLPTDGESGVEEATEHAIRLAADTGATLDVLFVVDEAVYTAYPGDEYVHEREGTESALEQVGRDAIASVVEQADAAGVETQTALRHGTPHEEILRYADDNDVDLVVMGSKQRSERYRRLLGSVTERVARLADRPVTIVKTAVE